MRARFAASRPTTRRTCKLKRPEYQWRRVNTHDPTESVHSGSVRSSGPRGLVDDAALCFRAPATAWLCRSHGTGSFLPLNSDDLHYYPTPADITVGNDERYGVNHSAAGWQKREPHLCKPGSFQSWETPGAVHEQT